ncbi:MAG TPA: restriction endonuclease subunit S [Candidatus Dormibacteraeota bacterium]|nr:restriction endonuclease subunit S [Candidatus Dormibacteraeota bacterium]
MKLPREDPTGRIGEIPVATAMKSKTASTVPRILTVPSPIFPNARYFEYFIRTAKADLLEFASATAQKNINLEILNAVLIPLPPLAEQQRILAKVDELIALCDRLEVQLTTTQAESSHLLEAVLQDALAAAAVANG